MKITDKMRLDWFTLENVNEVQAYNGCFQVNTFGDQTYEGNTIRECIDAAIRAGERNKI